MNKQTASHEATRQNSAVGSDVLGQELAAYYDLEEIRQGQFESEVMQDPLTDLIINVQVLEEMIGRLNFLGREARYLLKVD